MTNSRRTRLLPTRKTPEGSSRSGTATESGSKSTVVMASDSPIRAIPLRIGIAGQSRLLHGPDAPRSSLSRASDSRSLLSDLRYYTRVRPIAVDGRLEHLAEFPDHTLDVPLLDQGL